MLMTRRKRKEQKEFAIYLNNKLLPQLHRLKYLGLIFDTKLTFKEHINYMANKCTKLIFLLSKAAKLNWGLNHKALRTIYLGRILPPTPIRRTSVDQSRGMRELQGQANKSAKTNQYKDRKGLPHGIE